MAMKNSVDPRGDPCTVIEDLMVMLAANEENHFIQGSGFVFDKLLYLEVIEKKYLLLLYYIYINIFLQL